MTTYILLVLIVLLFGCQTVPKHKTRHGHRHHRATTQQCSPDVPPCGQTDLSPVAPLLRHTVDDGP